MNTITLLQPSRVVFGNGCAKGCVDFLVQRGARRVLLVTSKSVHSHIHFLAEVFKKSNCDIVENHFVPAEPTVSFFNTALAEAKVTKPDAVLGIGGGSALDVAKLIASLVYGSQNVSEIFGINLLSNRKLPLVCLPTTAGAGSEVSPNAILLDELDQLKKGVVSPHLVPDAAFIDPLLTWSVPPSVTAATGLDALIHCIEAYTNKFAHPTADTYALRGIQLISSNLRRAVGHGRDGEARASLALGSFYGGLCLGAVNTAAVHALAYPLGGRFHVAHGISNAVLLPSVLRFNLSSAAKRYEEVALALGVERNGSTFGTAELGIKQLADLSRACGLPQGLSDLGIPRDAIPALAKSAVQVTRLLKNNPRPVTEADAIRIYEESY
jgi:alcohol dehydrogenase class IV